MFVVATALCRREKRPSGSDRPDPPPPNYGAAGRAGRLQRSAKGAVYRQPGAAPQDLKSCSIRSAESANHVIVRNRVNERALSALPEFFSSEPGALPQAFL
jgi:hypothetical protein